MQRASLLARGIVLLLGMLPSCAAPAAQKIPTQPALTGTLPVPEASCDRPGTLGSDQVPFVTQGYDISFDYYLPPCYAEQPEARFPVIYLLVMPYEGRLDPGSQAPRSLAERLIQSGRMRPAILIVPQATVGVGYHAALAKDLVPYVDSRFRTLHEARYRGVGGISHGAAIAARMAFEFPDLFGSVGLFSGGIDSSEMGTFDGWIAQAPQGELPRVLISVGTQDAIWRLTSNFLRVLDRNRVPYLLEQGPGSHSWDFWGPKMESYLLWFAGAW